MLKLLFQIIVAFAFIVASLTASLTDDWEPYINVINTFEGSERSVYCVTMSPDGEYLLTGDSSRHVKVRSLTGKGTRIFAGHKNYVISLAVSADGALVASGSRDKTARLWKWDGTLVREYIGHKGYVTGVAFSPDASNVVSCGRDNTVRIWTTDASAGNPLITTLRGHRDWVRSVVYAPSGRYIASASEDATIKIWKTNGILLRTLRGHTRAVTSIRFSRNGHYLISGAEDDTVRIWRFEGQLIRTLQGHKRNVDAIDVSPDGRFIISGSLDGTVKLWSMEGDLLDTLPAYTGGVTGVSFASNNEDILGAIEDGTVKHWRLEGIGYLKTFTNIQTNSVRGVFPLTATSYLSYDIAGTVTTFDTSGRVTKTFRPDEGHVSFMAMGGEDAHLAGRTRSNEFIVYSAQGRRVFTGTNHVARIRSAAIADDGRTFVSGDEAGNIYVWDSSGKTTLWYEGSASIESIAYETGTNGDVIFFGDEDGGVTKWDVGKSTPGTNEIERFPKKHKGAITALLAVDGTNVYTAGSDTRIRRWTSKGKVIALFEGHSDRVLSLAISSNRDYLVSSGEDSTIRIWNVGKAKEMKSLVVYGGIVNDLAFSPNGLYIASASDDTTVKYWNMRQVFRRYWFRDLIP